MEAIMAIRMITRSDLADVLELERTSFVAPMSREEFVDWILRDDTFCLVYEVRGQIAGFMLYVLTGKTYLIHSIAVDRGLRFQGVASEMLTHLKYGLIDKGWRILCSVRTGNVPAMQLFWKNGFKKIGSQSIKGSGEAWIRMIYNQD